MRTLRHPALYALFLAALAANIALSLHTHRMQAAWDNVPPVPAAASATAMAAGDAQMAFRMTGMMLQNLGNTGGRFEPLYKYDYNQLGKWFYLSDELDPVSNFVPALAAFYFSASQDPQQIGPVVDYLDTIGSRSGHEEYQKWRYLAQGVFLARFRMNDLNRALTMADHLAALWQPGRPLWMKQMPAFVMAERGDRAAAYDLMMTILKQGADKMDPAEVNFMVEYICTRILDAQQEQDNALCKVYQQHTQNPFPFMKKLFP